MAKKLINTSIDLGTGTLNEDSFVGPLIVHKSINATGKTSWGADLWLWDSGATKCIGIFNLEKVKGDSAADYIVNLHRHGNAFYIRLFTRTGTPVTQADIEYSFVALKL